MQQSLPADSLFDIVNVPPNLHDLFNVILSSFYLVSLLMFVNLLVGMITNTYERHSESNEASLLIAKYDIMCCQDVTFWLLGK